MSHIRETIIVTILAVLSVHSKILASTISASPVSMVEIENLRSQFLPASYAHTNFSMDDAKRLIRQKCKKSGVKNPNIYDEIEVAAGDLVKCGNNIANITEVLAEIEAARPVGDLDVVFQKYCDKRDQAESCLHDFNDHLLPCLSPDERVHNAIMMRIVSSILGFLCHKNGDPIAIFIAEEGPECIESQKENIGKCMNATFATYVSENGQLPDMDELPELVLGPKQCIDLYDFEECVLSYLEQCNEITPANIVESMFKYVKNETKCNTIAKVPHVGDGTSSSWNFYSISGTVILIGFSKIFQ